MSEFEPGFHAAIGMASQKDYFSLTREMLRLLNSCNFVCTATLYEIQESTRQYNDSKSSFIYRRFLNNQADRDHAIDLRGFDQCAMNRAPVEIQVDGNLMRLVFFIKGKTGPRRLISVDGESFSPHDRVLLMNIVSFYEMQVQLLDDKERDVLTGLLNRRSFDWRLLEVLTQQRQIGNHSWLACFDIDHFKRVNDTYGHLFGDEVLLHFAQLMKRSFRFTDFLFRFGGEEFVVLFSDSSDDGINVALNRFRETVASFDFPIDDVVTVSVGYTRLLPDVLPTTLIDRADQALYHAKATGRNKVVDYESLNATRENSTSDVELF